MAISDSKDSSTLLTTKQVSDRLKALGIVQAPREVARLASSGAFPSARKVRGQWQISETAVQQYLQHHIASSAQPKYRGNKTPGHAGEYSEKRSGAQMATIKWPERARYWISTHKIKSVASLLVMMVGLLLAAISAGADIEGARQQLQEWNIIREFPEATKDEILIVISRFDIPDGVPDRGIHDEFRRAIQTAAKDVGIEDIRVEVESTRIRAGDQVAARQLGRRYNAAMVIWGSDSGVRLTVNYLNIAEPDTPISEIEITETKKTQLADPSRYAIFVTEDLPGQMTFLSLFALSYSAPCYCITQENHAIAIKITQKAIDSLRGDVPFPDAVGMAYYNLGWLYQASRKYSESIGAYTNAIKHLQFKSMAYYGRGIAHTLLKSPEDALADYDMTLELTPSYYYGYIARGNEYLHLGRTDKAIQDFSDAIMMNPANPDGYFSRGNTYLSISNFSAALTDYNSALRRETNFAEAYYGIGIVNLETGHYTEAIASFDRAIGLKPKAGFAYHGRAMAYELQGDHDKAARDYARASELGIEDIYGFWHSWVPYTSDPSFVKATESESRGQYEEAIIQYSEAINSDPKNFEAYFGRGNVYNATKDYKRAINDYTQVININPLYAVAYNNRGVVYETGFHELEKAIQDYTKAIELNPNYTTAYKNRGVLYKRLNETALAIEDLRRVLQLETDPNSPIRQEANNVLAELEVSP